MSQLFPLYDLDGKITAILAKILGDLLSETDLIAAPIVKQIDMKLKLGTISHGPGAPRILGLTSSSMEICRSVSMVTTNFKQLNRC